MNRNIMKIITHAQVLQEEAKISFFDRKVERKREDSDTEEFTD